MVIRVAAVPATKKSVQKGAKNGNQPAIDVVLINAISNEIADVSSGGGARFESNQIKLKSRNAEACSAAVTHSSRK